MYPKPVTSVGPNFFLNSLNWLPSMILDMICKITAINVLCIQSSSTAKESCIDVWIKNYFCTVSKWTLVNTHCLFVKQKHLILSIVYQNLTVQVIFCYLVNINVVFWRNKTWYFISIIKRGFWLWCTGVMGWKSFSNVPTNCESFRFIFSEIICAATHTNWWKCNCNTSF